ncbi:MAG TPA: hypothetical protein VFR37_07460 [Longimicrobium sp.]|nr:hypothetical protein [Longimicrobium sp.]
MFDMLRTARREVATEAVYFAGLRIRERDFIPDWRRWLPVRPGNPTFPESVGMAAQLLTELEERAGKPLERLTDAEIEPYRRSIHAVMDERYAAERRSDPTLGERALERLRREYGEPNLRAVA